jgi:hypothetical protein
MRWDAERCAIPKQILLYLSSDSRSMTRQGTSDTPDTKWYHSMHVRHGSKATRPAAVVAHRHDHEITEVRGPEMAVHPSGLGAFVAVRHRFLPNGTAHVTQHFSPAWTSLHLSLFSLLPPALPTMQLAPPHPPQHPFHFFPKPSSPPSHIPPVVVKTRVVTVPHHAARTAPRPRDDFHDRKPTQAVISTNVIASQPAAKRKSPDAYTQRRAKRARSSDSSDATPPPSSSHSRESSIVSSASSSRSSTRNRSSPPTSLPPSTRSRSRSSSVLPIVDEPIPRECHIDDDAVLDDTFLSSEKVVLGIIKSYVQCRS